MHRTRGETSCIDQRQKRNSFISPFCYSLLFLFPHFWLFQKSKEEEKEQNQAIFILNKSVLCVLQIIFATKFISTARFCWFSCWRIIHDNKFLLTTTWSPLAAFFISSLYHSLGDVCEHLIKSLIRLR